MKVPCPLPWCTARPTADPYPVTIEGWHAIQCMACGTRTPLFKTKEEAEECWRSRSTPPTTDLIQRLDQARSDALAAGEAPHIPYDLLVETIAALRSPPATDVALREAPKTLDEAVADLRLDIEGHEDDDVCTPYVGSIRIVLAALAPTPPDQPQIGDESVSPKHIVAESDNNRPQIGDVERVARALYKNGPHQTPWGDLGESDKLSWLSDARAAIAAMPKEDIWEEAARIAEAAKDGIGSPYRSGGSFGAARANQCDIIAAALRDRRAK